MARSARGGTFAAAARDRKGIAEGITSISASGISDAAAHRNHGARVTPPDGLAEADCNLRMQPASTALQTKNDNANGTLRADTMTHFLRGTAICGALLAALPAAAQQLAGGQIDLGFTTYDDLDTDAFTGRLSGELAVSKAISLQADLFGASDGGSFTDERYSGGGFTLHSLSHVSATSSVGGFTTIERNEGGENVFSYGVEAGGNFGNVGTEIWFALSNGENDLDGGFGGLDLRVPVGMAAMTGNFEHYNFDDVLEVTKIGVGLEYDATEALTVGGRVERVDITLTDPAGTFSLEGDDLAVSIGATYRFGKRPGTVFGRRSLLDAFR